MRHYLGHDKDEGGKWPYAGTAEAIDKMGGKHIVTEVTEAHVDANNKVGVLRVVSS